MSSRLWHAVDLDGTLARSLPDGTGLDPIGEPISGAVADVLRLIAESERTGVEVRIFTARAAQGPEAIEDVQQWCERHLGRRLGVTNIKDPCMLTIRDDRAVPYRRNAGPCSNDRCEEE